MTDEEDTRWEEPLYITNKAYNFQIVGIKVKQLITNKDNNSAPFVFHSECNN